MKPHKHAELIKAWKEKFVEIALQGTGEPIQTKTLELLKKERERIANNIRNAK